MRGQTFSLGAVLNITDGRLLSSGGIGDVYALLNYMTRDNLFTHQLPRAAKECRPWLVKQFPALGTQAMYDLSDRLVERLSEGVPAEACSAWIEEVSRTLGIPMEVEVERMPADDHLQIDPIEEAVQLVGADKVIVVRPPEQTP